MVRVPRGEKESINTIKTIDSQTFRYIEYEYKQLFWVLSHKISKKNYEINYQFAYSSFSMFLILIFGSNNLSGCEVSDHGTETGEFILNLI